MEVWIRADASTAIGTGHVMRCLTLAEQLRDDGARVVFLCRSLPGDLTAHLSSFGFQILFVPDAFAGVGSETSDLESTLAVFLRLGKNVDWLVTDHYGLDAAWCEGLRGLATQILVIDDLVDRRHECDLLLDQNLHCNAAGRYRELVPEHCKLLLGPRYALLRKQFTLQRKLLKPRDGIVRRILISFGGSDATNETGKVIEALEGVEGRAFECDVVLGSSNPHRVAILNEWGKARWVKIHCNVSNMAALMAAADLAIGAGGTTTWERCCMGLPTLVLSTAENQVAIAENAARANAVRYLGKAEDVDSAAIVRTVEECLDDRALMRQISVAGIQLVDGGGALRVAKEMGTIR